MLSNIFSLNFLPKLCTQILLFRKLYIAKYSLLCTEENLKLRKFN